MHWLQKIYISSLTNSLKFLSVEDLINSAANKKIAVAVSFNESKI